MKQILFITAVLFAVSCAQDETHDNKDITFYPIAGNIKADLKALDSMPVGINKYTTENNRTDTGLASLDELKAAAAAMTQPDISDPSIKKYYKETVFYDKSSDHLTMSYSTASDKVEVKKVEVMMKQETDKLRSIYVEKSFARNDTAYSQRMVWSPGRSMQVTTVANANGRETAKTVKYAWGLEN